MHYEEQSVSLRTLIQWGLEEDTERRIAALPPLQEIEALLGDTAAFRRRVGSRGAPAARRALQQTASAARRSENPDGCGDSGVAAVLCSHGQCLRPRCSGQYHY